MKKTKRLNMSLVDPQSDNPLTRIPGFKPVPKEQTADYLAKHAKELVKKKLKKAKKKKANSPVRSFLAVKKYPSLRSQMERFLTGRELPGEEKRGKVVSVKKDGVTRVVKFEDGTERRIPKRKMVKKFNKALRMAGMSAAMKSVKYNPLTGKAKVRIGGQKQGIERTFDSVDRANKAVRKAYGR